MDWNGNSARVTCGAIKGCFGIYEGIIMVDRYDNIWAAILDYDNGIINYLTNTNQIDLVPRTIDNWANKVSCLHSCKIQYVDKNDNKTLIKVTSKQFWLVSY